MAVSEKKKASNAAWDSKNIKRLSLALRLEVHQQMIEHVSVTGEKVNSFITRAIKETIKNDENKPV